MSSNVKQSAGFWKRTPAYTPSIVDVAFLGSSLEEPPLPQPRLSTDKKARKPRTPPTQHPPMQRNQQETTPTSAAAKQPTPTSTASSNTMATQSNSLTSRFQAILSSNSVDIEQLRKLSWKGIPDEMRAASWRLLMGYVPLSSSRQGTTLQRKRKEYVDWKAQTFMRGEDALDRVLWHQISIDVPRTAPGTPLLQYPRLQHSLGRVLYCWAARHPASGYVQGINDLATPFFHVFLNELPSKNIDQLTDEEMEAVEADSFWCLTKLLDGIQDNYTHAQPGIQRQLVKMKELVARIDSKLAKHLDSQGLEFIQFAFRWINCLLMREMSLSNTVRMWDTYLAEDQGFSAFHIYVCAAFLLRWSKELQTMDFQQMLMFLQCPPSVDRWTTKDIELLLSEAYMYKCLYDSAPSHYTESRNPAANTGSASNS